MSKFSKTNQPEGRGRPKGSTDKYAKYREIAEPDMPKLIKQLMSMALDGDLAAAKLIIDRCWVISSIQQLQLEQQMEEIRQLVSEAANDN